MAEYPGNQLDSQTMPERSVRGALDRVLESPTFANAGRLRAFLNYVVGESLAGRAHLIAGKTIAQDVYDRAPDTGSDSIVRVDARRLRRKLSDYYGGDGADDPIRIHVDSGGYAPRFEKRVIHGAPAAPAPETQSEPAKPPRGDLPRLLFAVLLLLLGIVIWMAWPSARTAPGEDPDVAAVDIGREERAALADKSAATLQASNLAEKASELHFPIADINHQKLAVSMYREAIQIDPSFSVGYSGAAHSLATLALLTPNADERTQILKEANTFAQRAIELDPLDGWSQSTAAWTAFVQGDFERAVELGRRAASLGATDGKTLDFHGLISLLTGNFEEAARATDPDRPRKVAGRHLAYLNVHGAANFHLGNPERALVAFDSAIEQGGPVSELTLMYKAASRQASGDSASASALLGELRETWPRFRPDVALKQFFQHSEHAEQVLSELRAAGWRIE